MDSTTCADQFQTLQVPEEIDALSLYRAFEHVTDHRQKRGLRYPLAIIRKGSPFAERS